MSHKLWNEELLPFADYAQKLARYFHFPHAHIAALNQEGEEQKPDWKTQKHYLTPRQLWDYHQNPAILTGTRFGEETYRGLIDIDAGSKYHPNQSQYALDGIREALENVGLTRPIITQSSWSEGIHLIYPFATPIGTWKLACLLYHTLTSAGFQIKAGQLETFPNKKRYAPKGFSNYKAHRLPLQPNSGSFVLDEDLQPLQSSIPQFVQMLDWAAAGQDLELLKVALDAAKQKERMLRAYQQGKIKEWHSEWEFQIAQGLTGYHQTNEFLMLVGAYGVVWERITDILLLAKYIEETAVNASGYATYCRHQHNISQRSLEVARCVTKFWFPYGTGGEERRTCTYSQLYNSLPSDREPQSKIISINQNQQLRTERQEMLKTVVADLIEEKQLPASVSDREQAINQKARELGSTGYSRRTLHRSAYKPLWHPEYIPASEIPSEADSAFTAAPVVSDNNPIVSEPDGQPLANSILHSCPHNLPELPEERAATNIAGEECVPAAEIVAEQESQPQITPWETGEKNLEKNKSPEPILKNNSEPQITPLPNMKVFVGTPSPQNLDFPKKVHQTDRAIEHIQSTENPINSKTSKQIQNFNDSQFIQEIEEIEQNSPNSEQIGLDLESQSKTEELELSIDKLDLSPQNSDAAKNSHKPDLSAIAILWWTAHALYPTFELAFVGEKAVCCTVWLKDVKRPQLQVINPGQRVLPCPELVHSLHPQLVYVRPVEGAEDWQEDQGIAVRLVDLTSAGERSP
jgi:hypothetical protein